MPGRLRSNGIQGKQFMIRIVCWNIAKRVNPWHELVEMARRGEADVALIQEAGEPPCDVAELVGYENDVFWDRQLFDRWPLVVKLSERVDVEWFRQLPPVSELGKNEIGVSGIGTIAVARVAPRGRAEEAFIAVSMYARWMNAYTPKGTSWINSDASAHRILSDLSAFAGYDDWIGHSILAAGDLNISYGATGKTLSMPQREGTVWDRFSALGLEFLGPQAPNGRPSPTAQPDVPADTGNVPTYYTRRQKCAEKANRQLDYAFASRGFHERVSVRALNGIEEWGPSDHCRLLIEVEPG